ncbi:MAG: hypothetical protein LKJ60_04550 [Lentilactobacillus buchneri]|nr:hypothetical protein [Lentilactobacillus buchneri]
MKIRVSDVFDNVNDIRKNMSIGMNDEVKQDLSEDLGIGIFEVDQILENAQIYFYGALLNKVIEVQGISDDMKELKARLMTMLSEDESGNGMFSPGLKVALYELEHIDKPFVHGE